MENILCKINRFFINRCQLAVLDITTGRWIVKPESKNLPYLKAENAKGRHILLKPDPEIEPYYLLADDLDISLLNRHHKSEANIFKYGRMVVETSPANYQVWIHCTRRLNLDEKRYWLSRLHSDPGADPHNRWGRCPGFRNRKEKYRKQPENYPLAKLIWIDWKNKAIVPEVCIKTDFRKNKLSHQPQGGVCHQYQLSRSLYEKADESATDFAYALALLRRGVSQSEIVQRIITERKNWANHNSPKKMKDYLNRTISKAASMVEKFQDNLWS